MDSFNKHLLRQEYQKLAEQEKLHALGHANGNQIIDTLQKINAKTVIPIHTEKPDFLKARFDNVWIPEYRATYSL